MVSQRTVKLLSKSRIEMPLKALPSLGEGGRQARRNLTYSFHSHQLAKLSNMILNLKSWYFKKISQNYVQICLNLSI